MASAPSLYLRVAASPSSFMSSCSHVSAATTRRVLSPIRSSHRADESHSQGIQQKGFCSRRQTATASMLAALSLMLAFGGGDAQARDIPIFGIRKVQKVEQEVVQEVKELVKEGVSEAKEFEEAVKETVANLSSLPSNKPAAAKDSVLSPALQAGIVAGAGVVASLVASSVVDNLVSKPSK
ncbi:hypothetical protein O6H91_16G033600 [Diphasiastrum complanatum]|uniref:Uncharacterized protein n=1 Tax=Diphasiastrum complanatum TaxID=34168 RepID=A0ACC2BB97_DIPCM|nr:hypothetical protein O6H91_16G033600 [Diphasiastrum complanatum]